MKTHKIGASAISILFAGCATSPYDFAQPTVISGKSAYTMTGFVKVNTEEVMRERIAKRAIIACRWGVNYDSIRFDDTGIHPLGATRYEVIFTCKPRPS